MTDPPVPSWVHSVGLNMRVDMVTAEVVQALRAGGIRSILLKGPATARLLYEQEEARSYVDADLLVPPREGAAEAVLARLGFVRVVDPISHDWPAHSVAWERGPDGAVVDVHRTFFGIEVPPPTAWEILSRHTETMIVGGSEVEVPNTPASLLIVTLHAASHGRTWSKSQEDVARALRRFDLGSWEAAARLAESLKATAAFATGLRLLPAGVDVADRLRLPPGASPYVLLRARGQSGIPLALERFATLPGLRTKLVFAARKLVPPRSVLRSWAAQDPRRPQNLFLAFFARLGFLARQALPSIRAWVRARRELHG